MTDAPPTAPLSLSSPDPARLSSPYYTDLWNAEQLVLGHGAALRYTRTWGWLVWDGAAGRWLRDAEPAAMRLAKQTVRSYMARAAGIESDTARLALIKHMIKSEGTRDLTAMLRSAQSEPGIDVPESAFDRDPYLLNCPNGVLDLRSGHLTPSLPAQLMTRQVAVPYDPRAVCPQWEAFLSGVFSGDRDLIAFIQRAVGYSLTGATQEKVFFLLHGPGANNGKSTLLAGLRALLGDYAVNTRAETFLIKKFEATVNNDIARLVGRRLVTASESEKGKELAIALIKELAGGDDMITARFLHKEFFDFVPTMKVWLATNHLPRIADSNNGIWNRIRLIPFLVSFSTPDEPLPGAPAADLGMGAKLRTELPGILAWAVRGCRAWQHDGLQAPATVRAATRAYRQDEDPLAVFLEECTLRGAGPVYSLKHAEVYAVYERWSSGRDEPTLTTRQFGDALRAAGFASHRGGKGAVTWDGLGLRVQAWEAATVVVGRVICSICHQPTPCRCDDLN